MICITANHGSPRSTPAPFSFLSHFDPNNCPAHFSGPCLLSASLVMVHQRSWNLWNDWKEVAHGSTPHRNHKKSNKKSSWKWKSWTACEYEGCGGWAYDCQKSVSFVPNASDYCLSPPQRSLNLSGPRALPVVKVPEVTFHTVTLLQFCWLQTRSDGWGETLLRHLVDDAGQVQDESDDT